MYIANWGCIPISYICAINLLYCKSEGQHILIPNLPYTNRYIQVALIG